MKIIIIDVPLSGQILSIVVFTGMSYFRKKKIRCHRFRQISVFFFFFVYEFNPTNVFYST